MYDKDINTSLVFLYKVLFSPLSYFSAILLIIIVFIMAFREDYFQYALRNAIWLTPIIIGVSFIWYWIIYGFDISIIGIFLTTIDGYLTILILLGINFFTALCASYLKIKYLDYTKKLELVKSIDLTKEEEKIYD
ncbi:MAG: hypothetical protein ACFFDH_03240 [Promethearchaeota archaeon]